MAVTAQQNIDRALRLICSIASGESTTTSESNGLVDGNPIRKKLLAAKRVSASISPHPQSTEIGAFNPE